MAGEKPYCREGESDSRTALGIVMAMMIVYLIILAAGVIVFH